MTEATDEQRRRGGDAHNNSTASDAVYARASSARGNTYARDRASAADGDRGAKLLLLELDVMRGTLDNRYPHTWHTLKDDLCDALTIRGIPHKVPSGVAVDELVLHFWKLCYKASQN